MASAFTVLVQAAHAEIDVLLSWGSLFMREDLERCWCSVVHLVRSGEVDREKREKLWESGRRVGSLATTGS